jgi:hypothetical protein
VARLPDDQWILTASQICDAVDAVGQDMLGRIFGPLDRAPVSMAPDDVIDLDAPPLPLEEPR